MGQCDCLVGRVFALYVICQDLIPGIEQPGMTQKTD